MQRYEQCEMHQLSSHRRRSLIAALSGVLLLLVSWPGALPAAPLLALVLALILALLLGKRRRWAATGLLLAGLTLPLGYPPMAPQQNYQVLARQLAPHLEPAPVVQVLEETSRLGAAAALAQLRARSAADPESARLEHELAHVLGQYLASSAADLPAMYALCVADPTDGCYHGILQGYMRGGTSGTSAHIEAICPMLVPLSDPDGRSQCAHGIGHGLSEVYGGDLLQTLRFCEQLGLEEDMCVRGVFMSELSRAMQAKLRGEPQTYLRLDDPYYPCTIVPVGVQDPCYSVQADALMLVAGNDHLGWAARCQAAPQIGHSACFQKIGQRFATMSALDLRGAFTSCERLPRPARDGCVVGAGHHATMPYGLLLEQCPALEPSYRNICFRRVGDLLRRAAVPLSERESACDQARAVEDRQTCRQRAQVR